MVALFVRKSFFSLHQPGHSWCTAQPPNEGVKLTIYTNTTTAAKPSLCFCNRTPSGAPSVLVQRNPRQPGPGSCGCYTGIPGRSGAASGAASSLLFYAFLRTGGREDRGSVTINPKGLRQVHKFILVFTLAPIPCGTQTNPFNCSRHQLPTADTG